MSVCASCRLALRRAIRSRVGLHTRQFASSTGSSPREMLAKPTWSVRSLREHTSAGETITRSQLHHLLRLAALPLPKDQAEEEAMISTLQSQLQFVRAVQQVDTSGVEPLRAIQDETVDGMRENTIGLAGMKELLDKEMQVGHYRRSKRVKQSGETSPAEDWDALSTASRRAGKYFVVESGPKQDVEG